jgi:uracil-DNA glycosylase family 4
VSDERRRDLQAIAGEAARHLEWLRDAGVREVPRPVRPVPSAPRPAATQAGPPSPAPIPARTSASPQPSTPAAFSLGDKGCGAPPLLAVRQELGDCRRCKLAGGRTTLVFGVGDPGAELMFVGEGPGADEDQQGEPFVGKAGQLLTEIITKGMKLRREDVYIANVVKCRPPENRNPELDEIAACEPFLIRQIEAIKPRVIVALGKFAAQTLLRDTTPITRLRGRWFNYHGIKLMPTLHPAYLLRNPADKKLVWEDIKMVLRELGALA